MKNKIVCCCLILCCSFGAVAQPNVNFNHLTGTANVSIPFYKIGNVPIGMSYSTGGIRVGDVSGMVGLGWNLSAGGSIQREIKGIADDDQVNGWLYNGTSSKINSFTESYTTNCSSESDEYIALKSLYEKKDTEPDVFYINTPFISGTFVFDANAAIKADKSQTQPYQDLLIDYQLKANRIVSFTITDEKGIIYEFSIIDNSSQSVLFQSANVYFRNVQDHQVGMVHGPWHLSKIKMPNGQYVVFDYTKIVPTEAITQKSLKDGPARGFRFEGSSEGTFGTPKTPIESYTLKSITSSEGERAEFIVSSRSDAIVDHRLTRIEQYRNDKFISSFDFYYKDVYPNNFQQFSPTQKDKEYEKRTFLSAVYPRHGGKLSAGYKFDYYGVYDYYNALPSHKSSAKDLYGFYKQNGVLDHPDGALYYNPALDEANRYRSEALPNDHPAKEYEVILATDLIPTVYYYPALTTHNKYRVQQLPLGHPAKASEILIQKNDVSVDPSGLHFGSLSKLTYPTGGNARFLYQANRYYDPVADAEYYGAGIRLKKTILHDGVSNVNNLVSEYSYDDDNGRTSGVIIERPVYAFSTPYSTKLGLTYAQLMTLSPQAQAEALSVRTNFDISSLNSTVLYKRVVVSQPGSGKTAFYFDVPATVDTPSANDGEWAPTSIAMARAGTSSDCFEKGRFTTGVNVYPFAENPNYDYQRGLLSSVKAFDESGIPVSQTDYLYTSTGPDGLTTAIYGMKIDKVPTYQPSMGIPASADNQPYFYTYGKYKVFTNKRNSVSKVTKTIYDPQDVARKLVTETNYVYNANHKRVSQISTTNSDGSIAKVNRIYVADYQINTEGVDLETKMIASLQQKHQNGIEVESFGSVSSPEGIEKIVSGSLTSFNDFEKNVVHAHKQFALNKVATIASSAFVPSKVINGTFIKDPNYELIKTVLAYDINEKASSTLDKAKIGTGIHWGYLKSTALAEISNANAENFLYSGFEEDTGYDLSFQPGSYPTQPYAAGRTGLKALAMLAGSASELNGKIIKSEKTKKLVLSLHLKASAPGTVTCKLKSTDGSTIYLTTTINFDALSSWQYYEAEMDASVLPSSFLVSLSTNSGVHVDDILIYPSESNVSYRSIGEKGELLSESLAGKTTTYYEYDQHLRNTIIRDDDKNALSKIDYTDIEVEPPVNPFFSYLGRSPDGYSTFELDDPMAKHNSYTWYFDDAATGVPMTGQIQFTRYLSLGTHEVRLEVTDGMESASSLQTIEVKVEGTASICAAGPQKIDACKAVADAVFQDGCQNVSGYQIVPTVFKIDGVYNYPDWEEQNISYDWQVSQQSALTGWTSVGTASTVSLMYDNSFWTRCIITIGTGTIGGTSQTIISNTKFVEIYKSNPSCPDLSAR